MPKIFILLGFFAALGASCNGFAKNDAAILPVPSGKTGNADKINLGQRLYNDRIFAQDYSQACSSCHQLNEGGADGLAKYQGLFKKRGTLNTPTIYNASLNFRQFWDGRAKNLEEAIDDHVKNPTIFANQWNPIVERVNADSHLQPNFAALYPDKVTAKNIKDALVAYLNTLTTPNSAFDKYLKGDKTALSEDAKRGFELFKKYGCVTCHEGPNMGSNLYQKIGIYKDFYPDPLQATRADLGRYNITGRSEDKYVYKVPTLRNIALTGPYLHDGSAKTLADVVSIMGVYQVGQPIPAFDIPLIVKFLESLNGNLPEQK